MSLAHARREDENPGRHAAQRYPSDPEKLARVLLLLAAGRLDRRRRLAQSVDGRCPRLLYALGRRGRRDVAGFTAGVFAIVDARRAGARLRPRARAARLRLTTRGRTCCTCSRSQQVPLFLAAAAVHLAHARASRATPVRAARTDERLGAGCRCGDHGDRAADRRPRTSQPSSR